MWKFCLEIADYLNNMNKRSFESDPAKVPRKEQTKGDRQGRKQGEQQKLMTQVKKKLEKGCTVEEIADMLEESVESISSILETIKKK